MTPTNQTTQQSGQSLDIWRTRLELGKQVCNGRAAYFALKAHYLGDAYVCR